MNEILNKEVKVNVSLCGSEWEIVIRALVKEEKYISAVRILKQVGYSTDDAMEYYRSLPEYGRAK